MMYGLVEGSTNGYSIHDKNSAHNLKEILPIIEIIVTEARLI